MEQNRGSHHAEGLRCDSSSHNSSDDGGADNSWYRRRALIQPAATDFRLRVWGVLRNCLPLGALPGHAWAIMAPTRGMQPDASGAQPLSCVFLIYILSYLKSLHVQASGPGLCSNKVILPLDLLPKRIANQNLSKLRFCRLKRPHACTWETAQRAKHASSESSFFSAAARVGITLV